VVASSGTSLTTEQIKLIKRFTPNVTVLYDGDAAGIKASLRGIDMLLGEGLNVKVALFPDGDDPDSFSRKHSASEMDEFLRAAEEDFIAFKTKLLTGEAKNDPIKRAELITDVVRSIAMIPDTITRTVYVKETARIMDMEEAILTAETAKLRRKKLYDGAAATPADAGQPAAENAPVTATLPSFVDNIYHEASEKELIYYLLKFGDRQLFASPGDDRIISVAELIIAELRNDELELQNLHYRKIFDEYALVTSLLQEERIKHFINHSDPEIVTLAIDILSDNYTITIKRFAESDDNPGKLKYDIPHAILVYKSSITKQAYAELSHQLQKAQADGDPAQLKPLMERLLTLQQIRNELSKTLHRIGT